MSGRVRSRSKSSQRKDDPGSNQHAAVRPEMKADLQELVQSKTGDISEDAPDVKGASLPNLEPIKIPEA
ncbi:X antigen family member 2-like, partial [Ursus americanus]|uniref:X antigen family member 2-like n=1 Tax=Ursus americanus TaxID=9643 RepID=UPI001E67C169